jgi:hypothetical protein
MAIVDEADIQVQLPIDKLDLDSIPDDVAKVKEDVERIIRGYLAAVFTPATLASWTTPAATPGQIRAIAGRLGAALIYRVRYSEDDLDDPGFAQVKYNEAMQMLRDVISGKIILDGVTDTAAQFDNSYFYPNSTAPDPIFSMDSQF